MFKKLILASIIAVSFNSNAVELNKELSYCNGNSIIIVLDNPGYWENNNLEFFVFAQDVNNKYTSKGKIIKPGNVSNGSTFEFKFWTLDKIKHYSVFSFDERFTPRDSSTIFCN